MKKTIVSVVLVALLLSLAVQAFAAPEQTASVICLDNGDHITVQIEQSNTRAFGIKDGEKTYTYVANDGSVRWKAVLNGSFSYTGTSSVCISADCTVTIYGDNWALASKKSECSGNIARATIVMERRLLGVVSDTITKNLTLSCDRNGNLY